MSEASNHVIPAAAPAADMNEIMSAILYGYPVNLDPAAVRDLDELLCGYGVPPVGKGDGRNVTVTLEMILSGRDES